MTSQNDLNATYSVDVDTSGQTIVSRQQRPYGRAIIWRQAKPTVVTKVLAGLTVPIIKLE